MPQQSTGGTLRASAVAYGVYLHSGSGGGVPPGTIPVRILGRYPELTLGVAEEISVEAMDMVRAGALFCSLQPDEHMPPGSIPADRDVASGYRYQVVANVTDSTGATRHRSIIWDSDVPLTPEELAENIRVLIMNRADTVPGGTQRDPITPPVQSVTMECISIGTALRV